MNDWVLLYDVGVEEFEGVVVVMVVVMVVVELVLEVFMEVEIEGLVEMFIGYLVDIVGCWYLFVFKIGVLIFFIFLKSFFVLS